MSMVAFCLRDPVPTHVWHIAARRKHFETDMNGRAQLYRDGVNERKYFTSASDKRSHVYHCLRNVHYWAHLPNPGTRRTLLMLNSCLCGRSGATGILLTHLLQAALRFRWLPAPCGCRRRYRPAGRRTLSMRRSFSAAPACDCKMLRRSRFLRSRRRRNCCDTPPPRTPTPR